MTSAWAGSATACRKTAYNYEGESLVNRNGNNSRFLIAPNNLSQTGLGIKGKEEFWQGWSVVFNASTGINPQSGQLANRRPPTSSTTACPGAAIRSPATARARARSSTTKSMAVYRPRHFGTLTFGRQRALGTDAMLAYDPAGGAYSFSFIGYNGLMAGGGDTQDTRWDDAIKYRLTYGPVHFGAMYKFSDGQGGCYSASATWTAATCTAEAPHNSAYGFDLGGSYERFSADVVYQQCLPGDQHRQPLAGAGESDRRPISRPPTASIQTPSLAPI